MLSILILSSSASADRRNYVWTYQYYTMPQDKTELEFYQTTKLRENDEWEYRIELEQGLTDRMDFAVYQIFNQPEGASFKWDAAQVRLRYRIGEEGQYWMDPLIYLEYNRKTNLKAPNKLEAKLILARTENKFNISVNPVYELFWAPDVEHELGIDAGISWQFHPKLIAGLESTSRFEFEDDETETSSYLGPTVSLASGDWWYTFGAAIGLNDDSDDARVRFLMGVGL
ncbi:MAG: hypothetical protein AB1746_16565 [Candidatus Zixiibacteriota bacterium]